MVTRMATLADGGRITAALVDEEIERCRQSGQPSRAQSPGPRGAAVSDADLAALLGKDFRDRYDDFDLVQLAHVVEVCRASDSAADAARRLFAVSMRSKKSANHTDRLSKYLARFGLKFKSLRA